MCRIPPDLSGKPWPSLDHQIIQTDLLFGILVVETEGEGSKYRKNENFDFKSEYLYLYLETFLGPNIPGKMSFRRNTLLVMVIITYKTSNFYLICEILQ